MDKRSRSTDDARSLKDERGRDQAEHKGEDPGAFLYNWSWNYVTNGDQKVESKEKSPGAVGAGRKKGKGKGLWG